MKNNFSENSQSVVGKTRSRLPLKVTQPQLRLKPKQLNPLRQLNLNKLSTTASSSSNQDDSSDSSHKDTYSDTFSIDSIYSSDSSSHPSNTLTKSINPDQQDEDLDRQLDGLNSPASILLNYHQLLSHFPSPPPLQQQLYQQSDLIQSPILIDQTTSSLTGFLPPSDKLSSSSKVSSSSNSLLQPRQFSSDFQQPAATTPPLRIVKRPIYPSKSIPVLRQKKKTSLPEPSPQSTSLNRSRSLSNPKPLEPSSLAHEQPIHVILRIRNHEQSIPQNDQPPSHHIHSLNSQTVQVKIKQPSSSINQQTKFQTHQFRFDQIIDGSSPDLNDQVKLYETSNLESKCLKPFLDGYNVSLIVYGQTGSGKSFTMGTSIPDSPQTIGLQDFGLIPRTLKSLFSNLNQLTDQSWFLEASFLEIYHEDLIDLCSAISEITAHSNSSSATSGSGYSLTSLSSSIPKLGARKKSFNTSQPRSASPTISSSSQGVNQITIREAADGTITWLGARSIKLRTYAEAMAVLRLGLQRRSTGSTLMNKSSSRSHAIFCLRLTTVDRTGMKKLSKFQFVDLAGSERVDRTKTSNGSDRFKEGVSINSGLHALGNVISALTRPSGLTRSNGPSSHGSRSNGYIPYRESKLTRLLQDSLGGNSKTVIIGCISPDSINVAESLSTLRYVSRSGSIKNTLSQTTTGNSSSCNGELNQDRGKTVERIELVKLLKDSKRKIESLIEENTKLRQEIITKEEGFKNEKLLWEKKFKEIVVEYESTFEKLEYEKQQLERDAY